MGVCDVLNKYSLAKNHTSAECSLGPLSSCVVAVCRTYLTRYLCATHTAPCRQTTQCCDVVIGISVSFFVLRIRMDRFITRRLQNLQQPESCRVKDNVERYCYCLLACYHIVSHHTVTMFLFESPFHVTLHSKYSTGIKITVQQVAHS